MNCYKKIYSCMDSVRDREYQVNFQIIENGSYRNNSSLNVFGRNLPICPKRKVFNKYLTSYDLRGRNFNFESYFCYKPRIIA